MMLPRSRLAVPSASILGRALPSIRQNGAAISRRTIVAAPKPNSGPLMERRGDRALPVVSGSMSGRWLKTLPVFIAVMTVSCLAIFNYQKSSSSVVNSTLYALRTNPQARDVLGDEIYFAHQIPWIWGELNQLHGRIDISFRVKGTKNKAMMRFKSERKTRMGYFETLEWSLEPDGGERLSLLEQEGKDPFH
ncbi:DUF1783-domain-containing protein [Polychaeton citri CBS 116435]|uniref:DUF1783-domain-containing protein n=1 Tax=Polychaeton citri CBS 116435 TaxID=1314669 RepID=A0A9P4UNL4_9PEZI|nr:DUF1783-domain-containing protein [Polychaeton citri CBS 116435]